MSSLTQQEPMYRPPLYPLVSRVGALLLLTAGSLKAQELLSGTVSDTRMHSLIALELVFGLWLAIGLYPRWSRIAGVVCFGVLLNFAIAKELEGRASCECFGKANVPPWVAALLDAIMLGALLLSPAAQLPEPRRTVRMKWIAFACVSIGMLVLLVNRWPLTGNLGIKPTAALSQPPEPGNIDIAVLERVLDGVASNHAALHTLVYRVERVLTAHAVKIPSSISRPVLIDGKVVTGKQAAALAATIAERAPAERVSRHSFKCWIRGDEVRQDWLSHDGGPGGEILMITKSKFVRYMPELRKALISTAEFADVGHADPIDLRCAGFQPPIRSIGDWLRHCKLLEAGLAKDRSGRDVVGIHVRVKHGAIEHDVTADFLAAMNYMPTRIIYRFVPDGGVYTVTDIDYQQASPNGPWIPRRLPRASFLRDTTSDPDSEGGQNISVQDTVTVQAIGDGVEDEDFDPTLPANTLLVGDLRQKSRSGDVPARVSHLTGPKPRPINQRWGELQRTGATRQWRLWPLLISVDLLLIGTCIHFRKRLAF